MTPRSTTPTALASRSRFYPSIIILIFSPYLMPFPAQVDSELLSASLGDLALCCSPSISAQGKLEMQEGGEIRFVNIPKMPNLTNWRMIREWKRHIGMGTAYDSQSGVPEFRLGTCRNWRQMHQGTPGSEPCRYRPDTQVRSSECFVQSLQ